MDKKEKNILCFNFLFQRCKGKPKVLKSKTQNKVKTIIQRLLDTDDELCDIQSDAVPSEVRDWLASTFTRKMGMTKKKPEEKPKFRSIVHAVQAGIFVERMYRKSFHLVGLAYPAAVIVTLKDIDKWSFDVFALNEASGEHSLKFMIYELFTRYDLINRFKIPVSCLIAFAEALEVGYSKYKNPYHNLIHAADVTQTVHYIMLHTGIMDLRNLVIEMVLSTDMSGHFQQIKNIRNSLQQPEGIDRAKTMSLILHAADISHPAKTWKLHYRWTMALMEEFFLQGDKEAELGLPFSPLCDRKSTMVAQSQIGFIDFIVEPTFSLLTDSTEKIVIPLIEEASKAETSPYVASSSTTIVGLHTADVLRRSSAKGSTNDGSFFPDYSLAAVDLKSFKNNLVDIIQQNKERWKELASQEARTSKKRKCIHQ
uniref:3',5'-cyclic-nucleotide phosphodiesterase n=1 Tax=Propithecus coquereli TaxID=379532 RepID=A0A2K6EJM5_PROCO